MPPETKLKKETKQNTPKQTSKQTNQICGSFLLATSKRISRGIREVKHLRLNYIV